MQPFFSSFSQLEPPLPAPFRCVPGTLFLTFSMGKAFSFSTASLNLWTVPVSINFLGFGGMVVVYFPFPAEICRVRAWQPGIPFFFFRLGPWKKLCFLTSASPFWFESVFLDKIGPDVRQRRARHDPLRGEDIISIAFGVIRDV